MHFAVALEADGGVELLRGSVIAARQQLEAVERVYFFAVFLREGQHFALPQILCRRRRHRVVGVADPYKDCDALTIWTTLPVRKIKPACSQNGAETRKSKEPQFPRLALHRDSPRGCPISAKPIQIHGG